jgi:hypothetical protein
MVRYLIVANQTLGGAEFEAAVRSRIEAERRAFPASEPEFHIVVPATAIADMARSTEPPGDATAVAQRNLVGALERLKSAGARATGEVGAADPMQARQRCSCRRFKICRGDHLHASSGTVQMAADASSAPRRAEGRRASDDDRKPREFRDRSVPGVNGRREHRGAGGLEMPQADY